MSNHNEYKAKKIEEEEEEEIKKRKLDEEKLWFYGFEDLSANVTTVIGVLIIWLCLYTIISITDC